MNYVVNGYETDWTKEEIMGGVLSEREALKILKSGDRPVIQCREDDGVGRLVASAYTGKRWTLTTNKGETVTVSQTGAKALISLLLTIGTEGDREAVLFLDDELGIMSVTPGKDGEATYSLFGGAVTASSRKEAFLLASTFVLGERLQKEPGLGQWDPEYSTY